MESNLTLFQRQEAARERLTRRHGGDHYRQVNEVIPGARYVSAQPLEVVGMVMDAIHHGDDPHAPLPPASDEDLDDALSLLGRAREDLDFNELELIDHARLRGRTWDQIGQTAGYGDRRKAQQRYRRLRERTPGYTPPEPEGTDS